MDGIGPEAGYWRGRGRRLGLGASASRRSKPIALLEGRSAGRWVQLAGQRLSRWIAPTTMLRKDVRPACAKPATPGSNG